MPDGVEGRAVSDRWRWVYPAALALALLPFAVAIVVTLLNGGHTPFSDRALIELRVRDVGIHPVTIGLYSRNGWAHPGPMLFYLLAVPYRLLGRDMNGLMVGAVIINGAAVAAMGGIARRVGGLGAGVLVLVVASAVARSIGMDLLVDPWVCWVTVLPFGVFCLLTWALADGRVWALPLTAVVGSYLAQTHVGYAPLTAPAAVVGTVWLVLRVRRRAPERSGALLRAGLITVGVMAVVWAPPVWNQLFGSSHNLGRTIGWFREQSEARHTLAEGTRIVTGQFGVPPDWISGTRRIASFNGATTLLHTTLIPWLFVPILLAGIVAFRRRDRVARSLLVMLAVTVVAGAVSVGSTRGTMYEYRLLWTWTLAALMTAGAVFALWRWASAHVPSATRVVVAGLLLATLTGLTIAQTADALDGDRRYVWDSPELARAVAQAETHLRRNGGPIDFTSETFDGNWYLQGAVLAFEQDGFDARVPYDVAEIYGAHRVLGSGPHQADLLVLANSEVVGFTGRPGWHVIGFGAARSLAATAREGARIVARQRALVQAQQAGRLTAEQFTRRSAALPPVPASVLILERDR